MSTLATPHTTASCAGSLHRPTLCTPAEYAERMIDALTLLGDVTLPEPTGDRRRGLAALAVALVPNLIVLPVSYRVLLDAQLRRIVGEA